MKRILFILLTTFSFATVINIPDDYSTIQGGIDASADGDTVLVQAGTYYENININNSNITLASLFITSADLSYISQTIIDGNHNGRVIYNNYNGTKIIGLTIQNGLQSQGGGIHLGNCIDVVISNNIIRDNDASQGGGGNFGGGLHIQNSSVDIINTQFIDNVATEGGGVALQFLHQSQIGNIINFIECSFDGNNTNYGLNGGEHVFFVYNYNINDYHSKINFVNNSFLNSNGSAINIEQSQDIEVNFDTCTFAFNQNSIWVESSNEIMSSINNCTFYSDFDGDYQTTSVCNNCEININNSIFSGAYNEYYRHIGEIVDNDGNGLLLEFNIEASVISEDPMYINSQYGNFNLQFGSPAIDSGDPDNNGDGITWVNDPDDQDPDGTRMDIGAFYFHQTFGCNDPFAINYNPEATTDNGSCDYIGCTDLIAINYDPFATIDSGDCYYLSDIEQHFQQNWQGIPLNPMGIYVNLATLDDINLRIGDEVGVFDGGECIGMIQLTDEITSPIQIFLSEDDPDTPDIDGFISGENISYKFWDASEQIEVINVNSTLLIGNNVFTPLGFSEVELQVNSILGCTEINSINYNPEATINDGTCILTIIGCMDIYACNFDPDANTEGDCLFFDCAQICDGSSYVDDCNVCDDDPLNDNECYGCMDQWALNYDPSSIIDSGSCDYPSIGDISMDGMINVTDIVLLVGVVLEGDIYIEYMDFNQDNYLNIIDIVILVDIILHPNTFGCIDLNAINYNPVAIYNDGSCEYECIDIDDNIYETVQVGDQFWMAENLKVTHYRNGDPIPTGYTNEEWSNLDDTDSGAFAIYDDDQGNVDIYGNLYNWYAVYESLGICPEGWQVPSDSEWSDLTNYLGSEAGGKLKETGFDHWNSPNTGATNESGFTALPGGYRNNGGYIHMGNYNYFWSTTAFNSSSSVGRKLYFNTSSVHQSHFDNRTGFSIRCIKDSQ